MTSPTTNKFSPEVRDRAVRLVLEHEAEHPSRWAAIASIAGKIGCSPHTLLEWVKNEDACDEIALTEKAPYKFWPDYQCPTPTPSLAMM